MVGPQPTSFSDFVGVPHKPQILTSCGDELEEFSVVWLNIRSIYKTALPCCIFVFTPSHTKSLKRWPEILNKQIRLIKYSLPTALISHLVIMATKNDVADNATSSPEHAPAAVELGAMRTAIQNPYLFGVALVCSAPSLTFCYAI